MNWLAVFVAFCGVAALVCMGMYLRLDFRVKSEIVTTVTSVTEGRYTTRNTNVEVVTDETPANKRLRLAWWSAGMILLICCMISLIASQS